MPAVARGARGLGGGGSRHSRMGSRCRRRLVAREGWAVAARGAAAWGGDAGGGSWRERVGGWRLAARPNGEEMPAAACGAGGEEDRGQRRAGD
ncbi:hypothetical protein PR202_gb13552 [Eleusine coracana subsp. coracana]|uniref:Uncharacterized protein n=1 Tax=Eleusine coracana subsp. coracana TaxID=191504 RepID=A0AAV5EU05_ELECO|nr:hypothetical protein PR202_gb13552 [Eleusine coracana subsp. coracana]